MGIAALITWIFTALGGSLMLAQWVRGGGHRRSTSTRIPPALIVGHFGLAALGLVLWIVYLITDNDTTGWVAFVLLVPVALLGFAMLVRWIPTYQASRTPTAVGAGQHTVPSGAGSAGIDGPPERSFPVAVVAGHGLLAVVTVVLVLLTNLGIGWD
jgi:hypothetical protein